MNGKELFKYYTSKRDYTGSEADQYAQLLFTVFYQIFDELYVFLEQAESQNKKIGFKNWSEEIPTGWELSKEDIFYY